MGQGQGQGNRQMRSATERARTETENLIKAVSMTADQVLKIYEINLKYATKDSIQRSEMKAAGGKMDVEVMMKSMQEKRAAQTAELKAVMNDDQKAKYETLLIERKAQRAQRMGGQGGRQERQGGGFGVQGPQ